MNDWKTISEDLAKRWAKIRDEHFHGARVIDLAARYGVTTQRIYAILGWLGKKKKPGITRPKVRR